MLALALNETAWTAEAKYSPLRNESKTQFWNTDYRYSKSNNSLMTISQEFCYSGYASSVFSFDRPHLQTKEKQNTNTTKRLFTADCLKGATFTTNSDS